MNNNKLYKLKNPEKQYYSIIEDVIVLEHEKNNMGRLKKDSIFFVLDKMGFYNSSEVLISFKVISELGLGYLFFWINELKDMEEI